MEKNQPGAFESNGLNLQEAIMNQTDETPSSLEPEATLPSAEPVEIPPPPPVEYPVAMPPPEVEPVMSPPPPLEPPMAPSQPPKRSNTGLIVTIVILVILCCCCVGLLIFYFWLGDLIINILSNFGIQVGHSIGSLSM